MINNNDNQFIHSHDDDAITVQVSDANSNLGNLLLEADWDEVSEYLNTPEGQHDVNAKNDPLGLSNSPNLDNQLKMMIPKGKDTAFFSALFVRAPYAIIERIYNMASTQITDEPEYVIMYILSIIPSEERVRLSELSKKIPYRTRSWSSEEYSQILHLLLQSLCQSSKVGYLRFTYPVMGNTLTPLSIAAYNPDVPTGIVQLLCTIEPEAMEKECTLKGAQTIPLIIAAASPIPPKSSAKYESAKKQRWKKVQLLTIPKSWYYEQQKQKQHSMLLSSSPEPTLQEVQYACEASIKRNEWELVREFLIQSNSMVGDDYGNNKMQSIQTALSKHDERLNAFQQKEMKKRERDEWLHDRMGLVMYPIDVVLDLISVVVPPKRGVCMGIVPPMS